MMTSTVNNRQQRLTELTSWCDQYLTSIDESATTPLIPIDGDASTRRYFRLKDSRKSYIVMDAPPCYESCTEFVAIGKLWHQAKLSVPEIYSVDYDRGFVLLEDFGSQLLLPLLTDFKSANHYYKEAMNILLKIAVVDMTGYDLPLYDESLLIGEMGFFSDWCLEQLLGLELTVEDHEHLGQLFSYLLEPALEQPQCVVHRDYHSRNLMVINKFNSDLSSLGIIDFQDAVIGPVTYDIVSLLRDCYVVWPQSKVYDWLNFYREDSPLLKNESASKVTYWFDWMGAQRHIKVLGIFSRLYLRDGKAGYLKDIPRVFQYLVWVCDNYSSLKDKAQWLRERVEPELRKQPWYVPEKVIL